MGEEAMSQVANRDDVEVGEELSALRAYAEEIQAIEFIGGLLGWDEKTKMPPKGAASRARQRSVLAGVHHERATSDQLLKLIQAVEDTDASSDEARVMRRSYEIATKLPMEFVKEFAEQVSLGGHAWEEARRNDDFNGFQPYLERIVEMCRKKADLLGYQAEPWDALHDLYEEGMTGKQLDPIFEELRVATRELVAQLPEPNTELVERHYPADAQRDFVAKIVEAIGFDLEAGRIDDTMHPFCSTIGVGDVRLTNRYYENWLPSGLFGSIHEAGHGIYNQRMQRVGLPATVQGAPGLGMHESQSRMFENWVGRSLEFWQHHFPTAQKAFPEALGNATAEDFHRAINVGKPSLIRVEADELTYNMHVGLRFTLERALINGDMQVKDLPDAWNAGMEEWVGVRPSSNAEGCLQDVHWSMGAFGYFPTYTLGNVYCAQFVDAARKDIDLDAQLRNGDTSGLIAWFDEHIYQHGCRYTGLQFVERIAGELSAKPLIAYLRNKFTV
jgi:carboxypeptidase Taq